MMKKTIKPLVLCGLLIITAGAMLDPYWWYRLVFERKYGEWNLWMEPVNYTRDQLGWSIVFTGISIYLILILQRTTVPDRLLAFTKKAWGTCFVGGIAWYLSVALLICAFALAVWSTPERSQEEQSSTKEMARIEKELADSKRKSEEILADLERKDKPPLTEPTMFLFLDGGLTDSLYGQFEPALILSEVAEETKTTDEIKGEVTVGKVLSTSAGREHYNQLQARYKAAPKNAERKLKDLIAYLYGKQQISRFGGIDAQSDELKNLDQATHLLTSKYGIVVNNDKLRILRDSLFAQELANLEKRLKTSKGLLLIEGDWSIEVEKDSYRLVRPFAENVSNPAIAEIKLRKESIGQRERDILERLGKKSIRLSVFGNVLVGLSDSSRSVELTAIAVWS